MSEYYCSHNPPCCPQIEALKAENEEQARLLGMSGSREAALLARVERLRAALEMIKSQNDKTDGVFGLLDMDYKVANEALKADEVSE